MSSPVAYTLDGGIAVISIDNPPVNALSHAVRQGLLDAVERFQSDGAARAAVIAGAGRTFIAGADIKEFGKPLADPQLPHITNVIEASAKPVVAALHGTALGGGLEVALGCHYRVAVKGAKVGLPEVNLGILPGAGGTQRTPRLVGAEVAAEMITSGRHVGAAEALKSGLIDHVDDGSDPVAAGVAYAIKLLAEGNEAIDPGPVEALTATGAGFLKILNYAVLPQTMPHFISMVLYRFESDVRSASILGFVGAGGIGFYLFDKIRAFENGDVTTIIIIIVMTVWCIDKISATVRRKFI